MGTIERLENELDVLWNMSSSNKLPDEMNKFDSERDPIEVLSEDLIAKELSVEVGFVQIVRPISRWWGKMGRAPVSSHVASEALGVKAPAKSEDPKEREVA